MADPTQAATVEAALHAATRRLCLEEQQALTFMLENGITRPACGHLYLLCPDGLGCFACLAKVGQLPDEEGGESA